METYEVSHKIETVPLAGRKWKSKTNDDGVILRFYNWRFNLRKDPVYAVGFDGKDDYLSQFSRKEKGCVYIPLDVIRERDKFRIVTGTENAEATEVIEETETYIIREVRCA